MDLSLKHPDPAGGIEIVSGLWQKTYHCRIDGFINELREADWSCRDAIRYAFPGCETEDGSSGSPIVTPFTRTVIGIHSTENVDGERCSMDNPCEVDSKGNITYHQGAGYGEETYLIYTCLNAKREIDLTLDGCLLEKHIFP